MAGSWSNTYQTSLTLPTGAVAPQQRISLDGTSDTILVYDSSGALIASVAASAGTDGEGNAYPAGISSASGVISQSIILVYSGTPAAGNLTASIAAAPGVDTYGNTYLSGVTSYAGGEYVQMDDGNLVLGTQNGVPGAQAGNLGVVGDSSGIGLQSSWSTALPYPVQLYYHAGASTATGTTTTPHVEYQSSGDVCDVWVNGSVMYAPQVNGVLVPQSWQTPTMHAGWASGPGVAGAWPPLRWLQLPFDAIWVHGTFHATSTAPGTTVATGFPSVSDPSGNVGVAGSAAKINSSTIDIPCYINNAGGMLTAGLPSLAVGDTFMISAIVPLWNIPTPV